LELVIGRGPGVHFSHREAPRGFDNQEPVPITNYESNFAVARDLRSRSGFGLTIPLPRPYQSG